MQVAKPKKGYKLVKTSFGKYEEIPEEWENQKLGELIEFGNQGVNTAIDFVDYVEKGYPLIKAGNIRGNFNLEQTDQISKKSFDKIPDQQKPKFNDILFANIGSQLGSAFLVNFHDPTSIAWNVFIIRPNDSVNPSFLVYFLKKNTIQNRLKVISTQSTMPFIQKSYLLSLSIFLPPLPEQKQITSILSNVDDAVQKTNQIIEQTQRLKTGMIQKLLTRGIGHTKFKKVKWLFGKQIEIPEEWEVKKLDEICNKIQDGNYGEKYPKTNEFLENGVPFITSAAIGNNSRIDLKKIKHISKEKHKELEKAHINTNDIIFTNRGANTGAVAIVPKVLNDGNISPQLTLLRINSTVANYEFIFWSFQSNEILKQIISYDAGSAMNFFGIERTGKFKIPLPTFPEQKQIASILSNVDTQIQKEKLHKSNLERLKKGLMQKLLTGQIRVKVR